MARDIVVLLDGTGYPAGAASHPTNVVRLFGMLEPDRPEEQLLCYGPGGSAFGARAELGAAYTYLIRHWRPDDQVYVFGFGQGARTARALTGLLNRPGLLRPSAEHLVPYAVSRYARAEHLDQGDPAAARFSSDFCRHTEDEPLWPAVKPVNPREVSPYSLPVAYLGLWDTVRAAGPLRRGEPRGPYTHQVPNAARVRHAVSLDEDRRPFREFLLAPRPALVAHTAQEVWFAGVHADVGGTFEHGRDEPVLSAITLKWITDGVRPDLLFRPGAYLEACTVTEDYAHAAAHRNGALWALTGRRPRPLPADAVLHASVRLRLASAPRRPAGLPGRGDATRWADPDWTEPVAAREA
ncbi:T6SS phospholipase effector Tle1-like catalytic domain-containing protein [Streptomyces mangrovisoli]|uniref:T6SS Phospholipase effector Tle1-like catalytic domain-containing protein n=1 Tax=Streptomyces mangrovisoli TaxID=1428628 RepID=A0A1J4NY65_9ACTN|nr:DUF2235 domain-containing protein [Streptomyces mangrovisoli]OIJ66428.1 hypothetical protein WN71_018095 [Streptomyces mangrovisoli]